MKVVVALALIASLALCHGAHIFVDDACDTGYALGEASDNTDCLIGRLNNDTALSCSKGCSVNYNTMCTSGYELIDGETSDTVCFFGTEGTSVNNYYESTEVECGTGCQVIGDTDCGGGYAFSNGDDSACVDVYTRDDTSETLWWLKTNTVKFVPHEILTAHDEKVTASLIQTPAPAAAALVAPHPSDSSEDGVGFNVVAREATIYLNYKEKDDAKKAAKAASKTTDATKTKAEEDVMAAADEDEDAALLQMADKVTNVRTTSKVETEQHAAAKDKDAAQDKTTTKKRSKTLMTLKKKLQQKQTLKN